jgi:hypothetical protein
MNEFIQRAFLTFLGFVLGFLAYPLLFVPIGLWLFPEFMEWWIYTFAEYLRLWGF